MDNISTVQLKSKNNSNSLINNVDCRLEEFLSFNQQLSVADNSKIQSSDNIQIRRLSSEYWCIEFISDLSDVVPLKDEERKNVKNYIRHRMSDISSSISNKWSNLENPFFTFGPDGVLTHFMYSLGISNTECKLICIMCVNKDSINSNHTISELNNMYQIQSTICDRLVNRIKTIKFPEYFN